MSSKPIRFLQVLFFLIILNNVYSQANTDGVEYSGVGGIGWGVIACIIALVVGGVICIFGLSTLYPGLFFAIGICIPLFIFIFFSFCPSVENNVSDMGNNKNTNVFIVWRWLYFSVMLAMVFALFAPICILWNVTIIPQRVDSRAQKKHDENYQNYLKEERKKAEKELIHPQNGEILELRPNDNLNKNLNNVENIEGYQQQPIQIHDSVLPVPKANEFDQKKFSTLKRRKTHQPNPNP